ncbi:MAG: hypothetical protein U0800_19250 [Isosphaeraceae bacterium]
MRLLSTVRLAAGLAILSVAGPAAFSSAQEPSALVKLLDGGKVPADRQGTIVEMIGKRGTDADLAYLLKKSGQADGFAPAVRRKALAALTDATLSRKATPAGDLSGIRAVLEDATLSPDDLRTAARLAGLWKVEAAGDSLAKLAGSPKTPEPVRAEALEALVAIRGEEARPAIEALTAKAMPGNTRAAAIAALAKLDPRAAANLGAALLIEARPDTDMQPVFDALLARQDGADTLAAAFGEKNKLTPDAARLGLRSLYGLGRSDAALVALFSKAAGLDAEVKPLDQKALDALIDEVNTKGDPARGEALFRRADLNCARCHALGQAGGGIGPDLSALGGSSPVDYVINSILLPDQAIKEEYQTRVVLTDDGQILQGIVVDKDDKRILLKDATGNVKTVAVESIEDSKEGGSLMPQGLVNLMTHAEFVDLCRFIADLGKPGRYAVPTTPVLMRWRVLKPVGDDLAGAVPDTNAIQGDVLGVDPNRWVPWYARVGGRVPLKEIAEASGGPVVYLKGEIEVTAAGPIAIKIEPKDGIVAWLDDQPIGDSGVIEASAGRRALIVRVDTSKARADEFRVELARPEGSPVEFTAVGGR